MQNLAGVATCDEIIRTELTTADITVVDGAFAQGEVPYSLTGVLESKYGIITFERAWTYWIISGRVPIHVAKALYNNEVGKKDIRVEGHCGCPHPSEWAEYDEDLGHVITSYHIDSQDGLNLFVQTIKDVQTKKVG